MPRFQIEGADKDTGDERSVTVTAMDYEDAHAQAKRRGLLVSRVTPATAESDVLHSVSPSPRTVKLAPPEYRGLKALASLFLAGAILAYACGVISLVGLVLAVSNFNAGSIMQCLVAAAASLLVGIFYHGISQVLLAFRDLVRNSFK